LPAYSKAQTINCVNSVLPKKVSNLKTHIETVTDSAAAAISLNNVFSAEYDAYKIIVDVAKSTSAAISFRLRASGTDNSSSLYQSQIEIFSGTSLGANRETNVTALQMSNTSTTADFTQIEILNPFGAKATGISFRSNSTYSDTVNSRFGDSGHNSTTSFDGFSIIATAGNFTGSVSVFGYRKS
jgi:hypothetical protein